MIIFIKRGVIMNSSHNIVFCLKNVMEKKHMSKSRLCRLTGLRFETIQGYYLGSISRVDLYVLSLLCDALNCNVEDIITYKNKNKNITK